MFSINGLSVEALIKLLFIAVLNLSDHVEIMRLVREHAVETVGPLS